MLSLLCENNPCEAHALQTERCCDVSMSHLSVSENGEQTDALGAALQQASRRWPIRWASREVLKRQELNELVSEAEAQVQKQEDDCEASLWSSRRKVQQDVYSRLFSQTVTLTKHKSKKSSTDEKAEADEGQRSFSRCV